MNITTNYLGLKLSSPIVPSAGPLSQDIGNIKSMEDSGAGAVVLFSIFEEQIEHEELEFFHHTTPHLDSHAEALSYFPPSINFKTGPDEYLEHIRKAKEAVSIPIIASLNGKSLGGWIDYAKKIESAGADALELNIYRLATDLSISGSDVESSYIEIVKKFENL